MQAQRNRKSHGVWPSVAHLVCLGLVVSLALAQLAQLVHASQGCPFDDASCREYCGQQGCQLGYCGHFAWVQCICRKCGDEWNWYDKVRYNPDQTVNQTELDSLKLNGSAPLILTNSSQEPVARQQQSSGSARTPATGGHRQPATLTTLLIPDLSDGPRLGLNDIPDENSDKFLDYLAKNHERLVQAQQQATRQSAGGEAPEEAEPAELADDDRPEEQPASDVSQRQEDTVEIQISSSNNGQPPAPSNKQQAERAPRLIRMLAGGGGQSPELE